MNDGAQSAKASLRNEYTKNGWVVIPGLVSDKKVENILKTYKEKILPSKSKFFRQNNSHYETNQLTNDGYVVQSFLDIHNYKKYPEFRQASLDIYFSKEMLDALSEVTGYSGHNLMQSMLFDANTATWPHQDWWYLDSIPNGHLLGAWIALEDIEEDAGRFYVLSGTQKVVLHEKGLPHTAWVERVKEYMNKHSELVVAPALKKGDVLFWNSGTIHGSFPTKAPKYSRKSLTAHYMPSELTFGNLFTSKPWVKYETYEGHKYFANQPEYSLKADVLSKIKLALYNNPTLLAFARKFQNRALAEM
jgi:phytanoyl-CoA hydroxylase